MKSRRPCIITGNWKMHKTIKEAQSFVERLASLIEKSQETIYLAVPFTAIYALQKIVKDLGLHFKVGAQNMNDASEGAFTGEIAGRMLKEAGAQFVLLGHSERRHLFKEDNAFIAKKVKRAFKEEIQPILCIGETQEERETQQTEQVIEQQIVQGLGDISPQHIEQVIIAYEPVWAIGTGLFPQPEEVEAMHLFCRSIVKEKWGKKVSDRLILQYGGSVNGDNAASFLQQDNVDGLLVGGASLSPEEFSQIVNMVNG